MNKEDIFSIGDDVGFHDVYAIMQNWNARSNSKYSYILAPRPNHGLMYIMCDRITFEYQNGLKESYVRGNIIYIPKGLRYKVYLEDKNDNFNTMLINFSTQKDIVFFDKVTLVVSKASAKYTDEFNNMVLSYKKLKNSYFAIMTSFYSLLDKIANHIKKKEINSGEYDVIEPALTYIDFHLNNKIYVTELAQMCLMSETSFRKYFKKYTGKSPNEYILDLKLDKSAIMLKNLDISINTIAEELGFYDSAYFYKMFVKKYNITPAMLRQKYKDG